MTEAMRETLESRNLGIAIGVVYRPKHEHFGNYVPSKIPYRYNAFIYLDETSALHPIHMKSMEIKCGNVPIWIIK
jgi:erythromycin esterase-like protein